MAINNANNPSNFDPDLCKVFGHRPLYLGTSKDGMVDAYKCLDCGKDLTFLELESLNENDEEED